MELKLVRILDNIALLAVGFGLGLIFAAMSVSCAHAQQSYTVQSDGKNLSVRMLMTTTPAMTMAPQLGDIVLGAQHVSGLGLDAAPHEIFRLEYGGCLRGPLVISDPVGDKEVFRLVEGADFPNGCSK